MLNYIITFFILAVLAGLFGFTSLAADFAGIARLLTFLFIILFIASLAYSIITGRGGPPPAI